MYRTMCCDLTAHVLFIKVSLVQGILVVRLHFTAHTSTLTNHTRSGINILDVNLSVTLSIPPLYVICKTSEYLTDVAKGKCLRVAITNQLRSPLL